MKQETIPLPALKQAVAEELARRQERRNARPTGTAQYLGVSLATLWRWHAERPDFPRARKIGPRATVWDLNEIDAWLNAQEQ
ncbi:MULTISPECIES: helix-turn-helix transcriptional regulator [Pseudomonadota]|jgi:predicted DNA-binding transcriptional regulator AlpA|uniref:AlpA family transcriptional regulator n=2 Tax=Pseudomonadota TaxID=1224 RepID=A0A317MSA6_9GAMM|nr:MULTISPECIES: AlpA family phage regulatory protein [Pseudomonadota]MBN8759495.1 AlpA family phage regulatory protein [Thiobacillus sp.]PWR23022.1 hypothetical protein DKG75_00120 [Zavarzinia compransoris]PWV60093.1 AlpA family transcriptional regulator [Plasticicumulans acidivorans]TDP46435.1 AlpA family transcriptional regulator [Zavarzinia compransoris]